MQERRQLSIALLPNYLTASNSSGTLIISRARGRRYGPGDLRRARRVSGLPAPELPQLVFPMSWCRITLRWLRLQRPPFACWTRGVDAAGVHLQSGTRRANPKLFQSDILWKRLVPSLRG